MRWRTAHVLVVVTGLAATQGCAGSEEPAPSSSSSSSPSDEPATPAPLPAGTLAPTRAPAVTPSVPLVQSAGGAVLPTARVVPVFFPGETSAGALTDAITRYVASSAWSASTAEYGIGPATAAPPVQSTDSPSDPVTSADLGAWITAQLDGTHPEWGPTDFASVESSIYVLYPPAGTRVYAPDQDPSDPMAATLCGSRWYDLTGWHAQTAPAVPGRVAPVVFAVVGRCSFDPSVSVEDAMTATTSHELVEAATDPYFATNPAWVGVDDAHAFWTEITGGGELGDLCNQDLSAFVTPPDVGYLVQRTWSNASAAAGHDPCVPAPAGPYFSVAADAPDVFFDPYAGVNVHGVAIAPGQSRTIDVRPYSDAPAAPWRLAAIDPMAAAGEAPLLKLSLDRASGADGDVVHLTIEPLFRDRDVTALYEIDSTAGETVHRWYGEIVVR